MTGTIPLRVTLLETWDEVRIDAAPSARIADIKRAALEHSRVAESPDEYLVKFRGGELPEADTTVSSAGIPPNAPLIVLRRRRVPVR